MSRLDKPATAPPNAASALSHEQIWTAIDALATRYGMTPSGLAKRAGLDATTFNRSKRQTGGGRLRWPSTESLAKVLDATGASLAQFLSFSGLTVALPKAALPLVDLAHAGHAGLFDDNGAPAGEGWDETVFPNIFDEHAFALEISNGSLAPLYRDGDIVIVSPAAPIRRGDRVALKTKAGGFFVSELRRRSTKTVELRAINPEDGDRVLEADEIVWMARIMWASQ